MERDTERQELGSGGRDRQTDRMRQRWGGVRYTQTERAREREREGGERGGGGAERIRICFYVLIVTN